MTIRLLDPPLHEFLPPLDEVDDDADPTSGSIALHEANPMLGTRGCRLGLEWPEIYEMQIRAIARAAHAVDGATRSHEPIVEIMHPLVAFDVGARTAASSSLRGRSPRRAGSTTASAR